MSRPLRIHVPNVLHHVTTRGNNKECMFATDRDHQKFLELLAASLERFRVRCIAYCLLYNHYHLLIVPTDFTISRMMQQLNGPYAEWFNCAHRRVGHLVQGRFKSSLVDTGAYTLNALRYVAMNPVEAGRAARPEDWPWSSYAATVGRSPAPDFLDLEPVWNALDTADPGIGRARFEQLVTEPVPYEWPYMGLISGGKGLKHRVAPLLPPHQENIDYRGADRFASRPPLDAIFGPAGTRLAVEDACYLAFFKCAYTLREIAQVLRCDPSTAWRMARAGRARAQTGGVGSDLEYCIFHSHGPV